MLSAGGCSSDARHECLAEVRCRETQRKLSSKMMHADSRHFRSTSLAGLPRLHTALAMRRGVASATGLSPLVTDRIVESMLLRLVPRFLQAAQSRKKSRSRCLGCEKISEVKLSSAQLLSGPAAGEAATGGRKLYSSETTRMFLYYDLV